MARRCHDACRACRQPQPRLHPDRSAAGDGAARRRPRAGVRDPARGDRHAPTRRSASRSAANACARSKASCAVASAATRPIAFGIDAGPAALAAALHRRARPPCASSPTCPITSAAAAPTCTTSRSSRRRRRRAPDASPSAWCMAGEAVEEPDRGRRNCWPTHLRVGALPLSRARCRQARSANGWTAGRPASQLPLQVEVTLQRRRRPRLAAAGRRPAAGGQLRSGRGRECSHERAARMRGAALLLVLWLIALLTALVGAFALTARIEHLQGRVLQPRPGRRSRPRAPASNTRITRVADSRSAPAVAARRPRLSAGASAMREVEIRIVDENGKVDLNQADATAARGAVPRRSAANARQAAQRGRRRSSTGATPTADPARRRRRGRRLRVGRTALRRQGRAVRERRRTRAGAGHDAGAVCAGSRRT